MEKRNKTNWRKVFQYVMARTYFTLVGVTLGISICKYCSWVWNGGNPRVVAALLIVGVACIVAGLVMKEEE